MPEIEELEVEGEPGFGGEDDDAKEAVAKMMMPKRRCHGEEDDADVAMAKMLPPKKPKMAPKMVSSASVSPRHVGEESAPSTSLGSSKKPKMMMPKRRCRRC